MAALTTLRKDTRKKARRANRKASPVAADARETAVRAAGSTIDWAAPKVDAAREWAGPKVDAASEWAAPRVEPAVTKVKEDVLPKVAAAVAAALTASEPAREEAKARGTAAVAALRGEVEAPRPRKHRLRKLLLLSAVVGAAIAGWKAWNAQGKADKGDAWTSSGFDPYSAGSAVTPVTHPATDDLAAASPDEAIADAADDVPAVEVTDVPPATTEPVTPKQAKKVSDAAKGGAKKT